MSIILSKLKELDKYNINKEDICIIGSYVLENLGIRKAGDYDLALKPKAYRLLKSVISKENVLRSGTININSELQVLNDRYKNIGLTDDDLFNDKYTEYHDGIRFAKPELEFGKKLYRSREKDKRDVILLQRYALKSKDWNWGLIPTSPVNLSQANTSKRQSLPKKIIKYALKGAAHPKKGAKKLKSIVKNRFNKKSPNSRKILNSKDLATQVVDIGTLLQWQMKDEQFLRYDTLIRYQVVNSYLNNGSKDIEKYFSYYDTMQKERVNRNSRLQFEELIKSVERKGYQSDKHPLTLDTNGLLVDGSHRLACALALGVDKLPVKFSTEIKGPTNYGKDWFLKRDFSSDLINRLDYQLNEILISTGAAFVMVLWPPAQKFSTEIKNLVESRFSVLAFQENQRIENFPEFIESTYLTDDIEQWKIQKKLFHMKSFEPVITSLVFQINDPAYRMKARTESYLSDSVAKLKKEIRSKYRDKVENYVHDIIVHIGDNPSMNRDMIRCLNNHGVKVLDEQKFNLSLSKHKDFE